MLEVVESDVLCSRGFQEAFQDFLEVHDGLAGFGVFENVPVAVPGEIEFE